MASPIRSSLACKGFLSVKVLLQLFYLQAKNGSIDGALAKIVDELLICRPINIVDNVANKLRQRFTLGTVALGPGQLRFFELKMVQHDDYTVSIDGVGKLYGIGTPSITRVRRRDVAASLSPAENELFASIKSSLGWLGITASLFCALFSSMFQQSAPNATLATLCNQSAHLCGLQQIGTYKLYCRPDESLDHSVSIIVFCDAGRSGDNGQICHIAGLLIDDLALRSIFHVISWSSHKAHRPVRSLGAAETIAAGEGIDIGKTLAQVYQKLLHMEIDLVCAVDSKDLFTAHTTQRHSIDPSICGEISVVRFEFEDPNITKDALDSR